MSINKAVGALGEEHTKRIYIKEGFEILCQNFFNHGGKQYGEIDLVVVKNKEIRFVEVKTRTGHWHGEAIEAVNYFKQQRLLKIIQLFLVRNPNYQDFQPHIDVVGVELSSVDNSIERIRIYSDVIVDYY